MNKSKKVQAPSIIHSEKGSGFFNFFKETVDKVRASQIRVQISTSPFNISETYRSRYDDIQWGNAGGQQLKKVL